MYTFFHRTGGFTADFEPLWQRIVCFGAAATDTLSLTAESRPDSGLILLLPERGVRLIDPADKTFLPVSVLRPGDRFCCGDAPAPDCRTSWVIDEIRWCGGSGDLRGWRITGR